MNIQAIITLFLPLFLMTCPASRQINIDAYWEGKRHKIAGRAYMLNSIRHTTLLYTQGINRHIVGLCIAGDEDVVLPPVILPPAAVIFFPDVAFRANVDIVVKFSADQNDITIKRAERSFKIIQKVSFSASNNAHFLLLFDTLRVPLLSFTT